eukprot:GILK01002472.1.p1 GENE.GILK01002472.1~~GILK01002472.1.p1  ORF type:complete len:585 (-),score=86.01 GILK01002472.1:220-1938(-)
MESFLSAVCVCLFVQTAWAGSGSVAPLVTDTSEYIEMGTCPKLDTMVDWADKNGYPNGVREELFDDLAYQCAKESGQAEVSASTLCGLLDFGIDGDHTVQVEEQCKQLQPDTYACQAMCLCVYNSPDVQKLVKKLQAQQAACANVVGFFKAEDRRQQVVSRGPDYKARQQLISALHCEFSLPFFVLDEIDKTSTLQTLYSFFDAVVDGQKVEKSWISKLKKELPKKTFQAIASMVYWRDSERILDESISTTEETILRDEEDAETYTSPSTVPAWRFAPEGKEKRTDWRKLFAGNYGKKFKSNAAAALSELELPYSKNDLYAAFVMYMSTPFWLDPSMTPTTFQWAQPPDTLPDSVVVNGYIGPSYDAINGALRDLAPDSTDISSKLDWLVVAARLIRVLAQRPPVSESPQTEGENPQEADTYLGLVPTQDRTKERYCSHRTKQWLDPHRTHFGNGGFWSTAWFGGFFKSVGHEWKYIIQPPHSSASAGKPLLENMKENEVLFPPDTRWQIKKYRQRDEKGEYEVVIEEDLAAKTMCADFNIAERFFTPWLNRPTATPTDAETGAEPPEPIEL